MNAEWEKARGKAISSQIDYYVRVNSSIQNNPRKSIIK